ncbi:MAG TPA: polysaccharide deacetylase family protein [Thermomicrobiaceae bacterium]|nr:polysaccharide deacetylase family protein [Thermomicrobiaceae bacterium]
MNATPALLGFVPLGLAALHVSPVLARTEAGRRLFPALAHTGDPGAVALTFDDGPDRELDAFLALLRAHGATATFFITGEQVARWPGAPARIIAEGHEIGLHGYGHRPHLLRTPGAVDDDLRRGRALVEDAARAPVRFYRPPHGLFSLASWRAVRRQGLTPVLWARAGRDWRPQATPEDILQALGPPRAGDILLLHSSERYAAPGTVQRTLAALPLLFEELRAAGLRARSVGASLVAAGRDQ